MTCNTNIPRTRRQKPHRYYQPHFGNLMNEFFNTAVGDAVVNKRGSNISNPAVNVREYDNKYELEIALPGLTKEDVTIKFEDEKLTVASVSATNESQAKYRLREFNYDGFTKQFRIPDTVDTKSINASFELGILTIILGKREEAIPQPARKITIK